MRSSAIVRKIARFGLDDWSLFIRDILCINFLLQYFIIAILLQLNLNHYNPLMRQTKTRQEVLTFLEKNHSAFTPYEISEKLSINTVTVYRVLDFLREQKLVHHIPTLGKWSACQCPEPNKDHGFLICKKCSSVEEFLSPHHCIHAHGFQCEEHVLEVL